MGETSQLLGSSHASRKWAASNASEDRMQVADDYDFLTSMDVKMENVVLLKEMFGGIYN